MAADFKIEAAHGMRYERHISRYAGHESWKTGAKAEKYYRRQSRLQCWLAKH